MAIDIVGTGLSAYLARHLIPTATWAQDTSYTPPHVLQHSFISYHRAAWLKKNHLWPEHQGEITGMRLLCGNQQTHLHCPEKPLGYLVQHALWLPLLAKTLTSPHPGEVQGSVIACGGNPHIPLPHPIKAVHHNFHQSATTVHIQHTQSHEQCATQWFTSYGICASLPLQDPHHSLLIISSSHPDPLEYFTEKLTLRLGLYTVIEHTQPMPLSSIMRIPGHYQKTVLLGDTRLKIHPLAGLGLNASLYALEDLVERAKKNQGSTATLFQNHIHGTDRYLRRLYNLTHTLAQIPSSYSLRYLLSISLKLLHHNTLLRQTLPIWADPYVD